MRYSKSVDTNILCRICLTQSQKMISLSSCLSRSKYGNPSILEALQKVMEVKIKTGGGLPTVICPMCLGLLNISYDLKQQFILSQKKLQIYFPICQYEISSSKNLDIQPNTVSEASPVEIIIGSDKYNLNDLVIVEEDKKDQSNFNGFLNNLGTTITASLVKKSHKPTPVTFKNPAVLINKVINSRNLNTGAVNSIKTVTMTDELVDSIHNIEHNIIKTAKKISDINVDEYIITQDDNSFSMSDSSKKALSLKEPQLESANENYQALFQSALNMHYYKCDKCSKIYSSQCRYEKHINTCSKLDHVTAKSKSGQRLVKCQLCSRTFKRIKLLNYHIKNKHSSQHRENITCEICGSTCLNKKTYLYHKRTRHSKENFICDKCGKSYKTLTSLKNHTLFVHTERNVVQCICPICGKTFHYKGGLFYHMKKHNNERKYCCQFCDKKFYTLMALKRHTLTHTGFRPYPCKFCDKRFFSSGELRKHEHLHTGFRPYHCQFCEKGFCSSYNMKVHLVSHSGPFSCKFCDRGFISKYVLELHKKMKHLICKETDLS